MAFWGEDFWDAGFTTKFFVAVILFMTVMLVMNDNTFQEVSELKDADGTVVVSVGMSYDDYVIRMRSLGGGIAQNDTIADISSVSYPVSFRYGLRVPWRRRLFPFNYVSVSFRDDAVEGIYFFGDVTRKGLFFPPARNETVSEGAVYEDY